MNDNLKTILRAIKYAPFSNYKEGEPALTTLTGIKNNIDNLTESEILKELSGVEGITVLSD